jgi:hypothetical protein
MSNNEERKRGISAIPPTRHNNSVTAIGSGGGIMTSPRSFSDLSVMEQRRPVSTAPRWRNYEEGLNLEGKQ